MQQALEILQRKNAKTVLATVTKLPCEEGRLPLCCAFMISQFFV